MNRICVVTEKGHEYYALVSRLRRAGLPFTSMLPDSDYKACSLILTTTSEASRFGDKALSLEDLDENPGVFKGQLLSSMDGAGLPVLVGVDPGTRTGMAVFYGETPLAFGTYNSVKSVSARIQAFWKGIKAQRFVVRVGSGNPSLAQRIAEVLAIEVPGAAVELVDESGTSTSSPRFKGVQRDQSAAAKIAFRKGVIVNQGLPRTHERDPPARQD
ncbi:MAG: hypothetical protein HY247_06210 [archaeon]|nr:MAG: hypothetical protein HY247_06210 [archaeon]